ncbi:hypothetical protein SAMN05421853_110100 [Roseivivax halotolerans]|uniref:Uncharacterized protein n=1 Tax=Roseivivax halotolerans TaxID=93684 RepID=A0A1I5ZJE7_9RHOB|nr:hypothetical protein [Roseivivax halotolerans]SFQ56578.1 hypothetical protein SAMN05421853_110100 [Roseivivax halotolerans]
MPDGTNVIENSDVIRIGDATVIGDLTTPEVSDFLNTEIELIWAETMRAKGGKKGETSWIRYKSSVSDFIACGLVEHPVSKRIDGLSFVYNRGREFPGTRELGGQRFPLAYRTANSAEAITALVIDLDEGETVERVVEALKPLDVLSVVFTSYSHTTKAAPGEDRFRIVVFLKEPYELPAEGDERRKALNVWKRKYVGFCESIGVTTFDRTGMDLSRLQRPPRRPAEDAEFKHFIIAGTGLDLDSVADGDPRKYGRKEVARRSGSLSAVEDKGGEAILCDGFDVRAWFNDLGYACMFGDVLDMIGWETRTGDGDEREIMCPNDAQHSNPSDPDDTACWMKEDPEEGFRIHCLHDHCSAAGVHTWDMVRLIDKAIVDGEIALPNGYESLSDVLCDEAFYPDEVDGETVELSKYHYGIERPVEITSLATPASVSKRFKKVDLDDHEIAQLYASIEWASGKKAAYDRLDELLTEAGYDGNARKRLKSAGSAMLKEHKKAHAKAKQEAEREKSTEAGFAIVNEFGFEELCGYGERRIHDTNHEHPHVFHYMENLCVIRENSEGHARMRFLDKGGFEHHLNTVARYARTVGEDKTALGVSAPDDVVRYLFNSDYGVYPDLRGLVTTPTFTKDGSLLTEPGYDWNSKLYYKPDITLSVPEVPKKPSAEQVQTAKQLLIEEILADFPLGAMTRPEIVEQALHGKGVPAVTNMMALILLPFMREMVDGPTPGHLLVKPAPGTGASLLTDVFSIIATGQVTPALAMPGNKDEMSKTLTSVLSNGQNIVFFDNINHSVDSGELASAMTTPVYQARILGKSQTIEVDVRCAWVFTGNSVELSRELIRRLIMIDLDAQRENPEKRTDFRHSDIRGWATKNRGDLVWACLTIIQNWVAQGMVHQKDTVLASYENWSGAVGGVLKAAGFGGFMGNREKLKEADASNESSESLLKEHILSFPIGTKFVSGRNKRASNAVSIKAELEGFDEGEPLVIEEAGYNRISGVYDNPSMLGKAFGRFAASFRADRGDLSYTLEKDVSNGTAVWTLTAREIETNKTEGLGNT